MDPAMSPSDRFAVANYAGRNQAEIIEDGGWVLVVQPQLPPGGHCGWDGRDNRIWSAEP